MQVLLDENGYIASYAIIGTLVDGIEVSAPEDEIHFEEHFNAYRIRDGDVVFDEEQNKALLRAAEVELIRTRREKECFSVINRGPLWYERLTAEQQSELNIWYQAWLDATITGVIPEAPAWL